MAKLFLNSYGKSRVRLTKVTRLPDRHELKELSVDVQLTGDFADTYLSGDNANVVATDSMKNTVYVLAKRHPIDSIEAFGEVLARHFVTTYPQVATAKVAIEQQSWHRIRKDGQPHPHAFIAGSNELRTCDVHAAAEGEQCTCRAGVKGLLVMKTTGSAFTGYVRDEYTTLPETTDRIFATSVKANWTYDDAPADAAEWNDRFALVRRTMLDLFAAHRSLSVQQTLYAMGEAVLAACPRVSVIGIDMPNQHRVPFNFAPFGQTFDNDIFVPTDEPFGVIHAIITRQ